MLAWADAAEASPKALIPPPTAPRTPPITAPQGPNIAPVPAPVAAPPPTSVIVVGLAILLPYHEGNHLPLWLGKGGAEPFDPTIAPRVIDCNMAIDTIVVL